MCSPPDRESDGPGRSTRALLARLERPLACEQWAELPTPVERMPWLDQGGTEVWIKRDDLSSPIYGGGKVRKLEWVLANAPFAGDEPIVSVGGVGSHHLVALVLYLREQGRKLHALTFEQVLTDHVRTNLGVLASLGTQFWHASRRPGLAWAWLSYHLWKQPAPKGVFMAAGASTPIGCFGFVEAGLELAAQIEAGELPKPDIIYVTAGSAGTCAGLAIGLGLAGVKTHLHLVSSVEAWAFNRFMYRRKIASAWSALRQAGLQDAPASVMPMLRDVGITWEIDYGEVGGGYGIPTPDALAAIDAAREHGIALEPTYTGKCIAALRRHEGGSAPRSVLFWHTHASNDLKPLVEPDWEQRCPAALQKVLKR